MNEKLFQLTPDIDSDTEDIQTPPAAPSSSSGRLHVEPMEVKHDESVFPVDNTQMPTILSKIEWCNEGKLRLLIKNKFVDSKLRVKLKRYQKECHVAKNQYHVEYTYSKYSINESGRLFCRNGLGLQSFPRDVRAYLCQEYYDDIDQVNSMPTIMAQTLEQADIIVPEFKEYVEDRDKILIEEKQSKKGVLSILLSANSKPTSVRFRKIHSALYRGLIPTLQEGESFWSQLWKHLKTIRQKSIKDNLEGAFLSIVMQTCENQSLKKMLDFFANEKLSPDVLIFDGVQVRKNPMNPITEQLLERCQKYVEDTTHLSIKLAIKPMKVSDEFYTKHHLNAKYTSPKDIDDDEDSEEEEEPDNAIYPIPRNEEFSVQKLNEISENGKKPKLAVSYLNNFLAKITHESTVFYCWRDSPSEPWLFRSKYPIMQALSHLRMYEEKKTPKGKKYVASSQIFHFWDNCDSILTFKNIVMKPSYVGDQPFKELNLFRGFKAKQLLQYDKDKIQPLLNHIKDVLNGGIDEHFNYNIDWLASIVQFPGEKNRTALISYGEQGTGKNMPYEFFSEKVIGRDHYLYLNNLDDLTGQFTSLSTAKTFVLGDEISFAGGYRTNSIIKSKVTQAWQKLEKKGVDPVMIDDYMNLAFLSNHDDCMRIEDTDRRYYVKRTSSIHRNDHKYFSKLAATLTDDTANHFFTYLMQRDLSSFNVRNIPETEEKQDMKIWAKTPIELFADELLDGNIAYRKNATLEHPDDKFKGAPLPDLYFEKGEEYDTSMNELFRFYREFVDSGHAGRKAGGEMSKIGFSRLIRKFVNIHNESKDRHGGTPIVLRVARPTEV
ncbi:hypothetical protein DFS34DRAFT_670029 [Phlyctochytrium arcticum]|nr:hypothetical protein DFS34DRAFT_670029 [Phlyctochytrium arcticum]